MRGGGSEKVMLNIAKHLNREHFEISLICVQLEGEYFIELPKDILVEGLGVKRASRGIIQLYKKIKKLQPDIILSTNFQVNILVLLLKPIFRKIKILIREGSIVSENLNKNKIIFSWLYTFFYNKSDHIICQSTYMAEDLIKNFKIKSNLIKIIRNPLDFQHLHKSTNRISSNPFLNYVDSNAINLLTVGRLNKVKNQSHLIKAFSQNFEGNRSYNLFIIGQGELKETLKNLITSLKVQDQVFLIDFQQNPYIWMKYADLFILPSLFEGLPNSLLEAIACETPVITTNHPGGSVEVMNMIGLSNRIVDISQFKYEWFNKPDIAIWNQLYHHFHSEKIVKTYEILFSEQVYKS